MTLALFPISFLARHPDQPKHTFVEQGRISTSSKHSNNAYIYHSFGALCIQPSVARAYNNTNYNVKLQC